MTDVDERGKFGHKFDDGEAKAALEYLMAVAEMNSATKVKLDERVLTRLAQRDEEMDTPTVLVMWSLMRICVRLINRCDKLEREIRLRDIGAVVEH